MEYNRMPMILKMKHFIYKIAVPASFLLIPIFSIAAGITVENPFGTNDVQEIINNVLDALLTVAGTIAVAMIVYGGILYMISGDNKELHERAIKTLTRAVIGLIIIMIAGAAINFIIGAVQGTN